MTISEKLDSLREQLGQILDELRVERPDIGQACGHPSIDNGRKVDLHRAPLRPKKSSAPFNIVRN
jgi:hypothetical protein